MAKKFNDFDKVLKLNSAEPFDDGFKYMNKIFIIPTVLFAVKGFFDDEIGLLLGAFVGALIGGTIIQVMMMFMVREFRFREIKFHLAYPYESERELNEKLPEIFKNKGVEVYKTSLGEEYALKHNGLIYDVQLNDDNTFSLHWRVPISGLLMSRFTLFTYRQLVVSMPYLAYTIQKYHE